MDILWEITVHPTNQGLASYKINGVSAETDDSQKLLLSGVTQCSRKLKFKNENNLPFLMGN